jgi:hypothetical protein
LARRRRYREPLFPEDVGGEDESREPPSGDAPELNPFLARILETSKETERL